MTILISALAPIAAVIIYIYIKDKYEKEPKRLLIACFLFGGVVSIFLTTILYLLFDFILPLPDKYNIIEQFARAFFIVALTEEFSKYVIVRYFAQTRKAFNEPFDGIIYAVMVSMGFAAVENIFYVIEGGLQAAFLRAFTAVPAHATFGILMGYFMGKAKFFDNRVRDNLLGLALAILFHGAYDFFLFINFIPGISIGAFISLFIAIVLSKRAIKMHQEISFFKHTKSVSKK